MKNAFVLTLIVIAATACNDKPAYTVEKEDEMVAACTLVDMPEAQARSRHEYEQDMSGGSATVQKIPSQIIRNANIRFQVKDIEASHGRIETLLKEYASYFGSDNKSNNTRDISSDMVIRVPSSNFDKLVSALEKESVYINYKNITAEDVTAEYVDLQARLKTKHEIEERYTALLKQAVKVTDVLEIEEKLGAIREEIEASEGRLKLLKDQVGYGTITLSMYQALDYTPEPQLGFLSNLKEAFVNGWRNLIELLLGMVRVWPYVLLAVLAVVILVRKIRSRRLAKK
ncbi:MAG TPA: DUF4349 domain-containing protein [Chitinophagales bacterium]|nr:DUF4349 domain-containing protein [Chitinophagales bacterium]